MLTDEERLRDQLSGDIDGLVRTIYLLLARAKLPKGYQVRPSGHGYIEKELRFELCERWYFSAVLNRSWVLWYFRRPALFNLGVASGELLSIFKTAEVTGQEEIKLRLKDLSATYGVLGWVTQNG